MPISTEHKRTGHYRTLQYTTRHKVNVMSAWIKQMNIENMLVGTELALPMMNIAYENKINKITT